MNYCRANSKILQIKSYISCHEKQNNNILMYTFSFSSNHKIYYTKTMHILLWHLNVMTMAILVELQPRYVTFLYSIPSSLNMVLIAICVIFRLFKSWLKVKIYIFACTMYHITPSFANSSYSWYFIVLGYLICHSCFNE